MNDRIKQLAEQAQQYAEYVTPQGLEWFDTFKEKFAELIVRECAQEAYDCGKQFRNDEHYRADNLWPHFERVCDAVGDDIKIKFGVKE